MKLGELNDIDFGSSVAERFRDELEITINYQFSHEIFFLWFEIYGAYDKILNPEWQ